MRILQLTPGTGHFHCGNCLRDAALAKALNARGHDATIIPLYLPIHTEDAPVPAEPRVSLGGINMYLQHKMPWTARLPRFARDLLDSPRLLRWSAKQGDLTDAEKHADMTIAMLRADESTLGREIGRFIERMQLDEKPDVIILCNMLLAGLARPLKRAFDVPIIANMHGEDGFLNALGSRSDEAWKTLGTRSDDIDAFIAVSRYYADVMHDRLGIDDARTHVVHNGIPLHDIAASRERPTDGPPVIGYLARMCEDKGLHTLVDAYIELRRRSPDRPLRLRVAGVQLKQDKPLVKRLQQRLEHAGLLDECTFMANVSREEKLAHLADLDVFSVPATYGEAFGLYVLEALAHGVPVVQPRHGAFPELLEHTGGGLLCEPDNAASLADQIESLLGDPARAKAVGEEGRERVHAQFGSDHMAQRVEQVLLRATGRQCESQLDAAEAVVS